MKIKIEGSRVKRFFRRYKLYFILFALLIAFFAAGFIAAMFILEVKADVQYIDYIPPEKLPLDVIPTIPEKEHMVMRGDTALKKQKIGVFRVSAYCLCIICCDIWSAEHPSRIGTNFVQMTANGSIPIVGKTIAVDPDMIPYGTILIIDGNKYIAQDTGGSIKGKRIDILVSSHDKAIKYGIQYHDVYMSKERIKP